MCTTLANAQHIVSTSLSFILKNTYTTHYHNTLPYPLYIQYCRFRTSNHKLAIETGRHRGIPRHERYCTSCNEGKMGDEFHMILECSAFKRQRSKFIDNVYTNRPNALKFGNLFNSSNPSTILRLVKFIKAASWSINSNCYLGLHVFVNMYTLSLCSDITIPYCRQN
jgi:hypothetical protein